ncbi:mandelate racemase/muconate lactonizing enzyme family protein [Candidatus Halobonum tyrrellensis]|uniref:o-succinylbenzoate synthase n=1 Tax=Candidatus Halobonum tyrrellensis G22 TaxID=1324957 RepID=V4IZL3_9EURY|nr:enolase C-terminal domain-like protein [Candidatus Halobonum tyrrellensis]ESP88582.1 O-succinylbenzoate synthase [Candidatus Halobonum tyrrellensis G22]
MDDELADPRVRLREVSLPLRSPLGTANGEMTERRVVLVGVAGEWTDGTPARGVGEAAPLPPWTEGYDDCLDALRSARETVHGGGEPRLDDLPAAAHHAVTLAGLDAEARREGVPLAGRIAERSGVVADPAESVPVNATVGDGSVEETVEAAETAVADGFDCLKCKVGARGLDADLDRLRAVRDAVGDRVTLRADANGAWERREAERAVDALADLEFAYVEQPLPADDFDGLATLRGRGIDIALDESLNGGAWPDPIDEYADVAVIKPMAQAGVVPTASLARHLDSRGVDTVITTTVDAAVARAAAVHAAAVVPGGADRAQGLATGGMLAEDVTPTDPAPVVDGAVRVPDGPGLADDAFDGVV